MWKNIKKCMCYLLIILLLPYIITVFINGSVFTMSTNTEKRTVTVEKDDSQTEILLDDYGIGILAREIPVTYEAEALKAQAILVRTRIYQLIEKNGSDYIFEEEYWSQTEMEETWGIVKYAVNYKKLESAWMETEGQVLLFENELAYAPFFSLSNGNTRDGAEVLGEDYSYLKIKDCPLDIEAVEQLQTVIFDETDVEILSRDRAGYVLKIRIGKEEISGEEFRNNCGLASSAFEVQEYEGKLRITTRGVGHGLGMSQYTANKMAEDGSDYREILNYFFEDCRINIVADIIQREV